MRTTVSPVNREVSRFTRGLSRVIECRDPCDPEEDREGLLTPLGLLWCCLLFTMKDSVSFNGSLDTKTLRRTFVPTKRDTQDVDLRLTFVLIGQRVLEGLDDLSRVFRCTLFTP